MEMKFELVEKEAEESVGAIIKIVGVGGCGCNIVNDMCEIGINEAELIAVNTDVQSLQRVDLAEKVHIGKKLRGGRGSGNNPGVGEKAAEEDREYIENMLRGTDLLFITAGLGGGTGSGAAPVIAEIAREMDILTVAVVITPFEMELDSRKEGYVKDSMKKLKDKVKNVIEIPNDRIYEACDKQMNVIEAYREINKALIRVINGLVQMITMTGIQNIDFEDVKTTLQADGDAFLGIGRESGTEKVRKAFEKAINDPYTGKIELNGARNILINFVGNINIEELREIKNVKDLVGGDASVKFGMASSPELGEDIEVVVLMSGMNAGNEKETKTQEERTVKKAKDMTSWIRKNVDDDYNDVDRPTWQRIELEDEDNEKPRSIQ
ncbi:MAG: cell division protein FtsZ [Candidatus Goldiibacteriota bacterium]